MGTKADQSGHCKQGRSYQKHCCRIYVRRQRVRTDRQGYFEGFGYRSVKRAGQAHFLNQMEGAILWQNQKSFECAVLCGGRHIGGVNIYIVDEGQKIAELGWCLNKKAQGYGYAFEAAEALVNWAKEVLGVKCFIAHCDSENIPSWKTMEKLGMRRVSCTGGRFNKSAPNEERKEFMYEMKI